MDAVFWQVTTGVFFVLYVVSWYLADFSLKGWKETAVRADEIARERDAAVAERDQAKGMVAPLREESDRYRRMLERAKSALEAIAEEGKQGGP